MVALVDVLIHRLCIQKALSVDKDEEFFASTTGVFSGPAIDFWVLVGYSEEDDDEYCAILQDEKFSSVLSGKGTDYDQTTAAFKVFSPQLITALNISGDMSEDVCNLCLNLVEDDEDVDQTPFTLHNSDTGEIGISETAFKMPEDAINRIWVNHKTYEGMFELSINTETHQLVLSDDEIDLNEMINDRETIAYSNFNV